MYNLELVFFNNLCDSCLFRYQKLNDYYRDYLSDPHLIKSEHFIDYFNIDNYISYLSNIILASHHRQEIVDIDKFDNLPQLFNFIYNIKTAADRQMKALEKNRYESKLYALSDYQFSDGVLSFVNIDRNERKCEIGLNHVIAYGDKRINKDSDVEYLDLIITFTNVKSVLCKGNVIGFLEEYLPEKYASSQVISFASLTKESDFNFSLLCDALCDYLAIEIIYSKVDVSAKPYQSYQI